MLDNCIFCKGPESLCQCPPEVLMFAAAHVEPFDNDRGIVDGETLRLLIERAIAWGRLQSKEAIQGITATNGTA